MNENDQELRTENEHGAYLLRVWQEQGHGWRVSVQPVHTRERLGFDSLQSAMDFIETTLLGEDEMRSPTIRPP